MLMLLGHARSGRTSPFRLLADEPACVCAYCCACVAGTLHGGTAGPGGGACVAPMHSALQDATWNNGMPLPGSKHALPPMQKDEFNYFWGQPSSMATQHGAAAGALVAASAATATAHISVEEVGQQVLLAPLGGSGGGGKDGVGGWVCGGGRVPVCDVCSRDVSVTLIHRCTLMGTVAKLTNMGHMGTGSLSSILLAGRWRAVAIAACVPLCVGGDGMGAAGGAEGAA